MFNLRNSFTEALPVKLTESEILQKSAVLSDMLQQKATKELEKKIHAAAAKVEIDNLGREIAEVSGHIRTRSEPRPVDCFERLRTDENIVDIIRSDTFETVRSRPLTDSERQLVLKEVTAQARANRAQETTANATTTASAKAPRKRTTAAKAESKKQGQKPKQPTATQPQDETKSNVTPLTAKQK